MSNLQGKTAKDMLFVDKNGNLRPASDASFEPMVVCAGGVDVLTVSRQDGEFDSGAGEPEGAWHYWRRKTAEDAVDSALSWLSRRTVDVDVVHLRGVRQG